MKFLTGFRKFTMGAVFLAISLALLLTGWIEGSEWLSHNRDVVVAFMATNVGEHIVNVAKQYFNDKIIDKVINK